ncbi:MAG: DNA polymerase [Oscillospiraceae bacterium]
MRHLSIDIETYSSVDIGKAGLYKYVQSPDFEILLLAYSFDSEPVRIVDLASKQEIPFEVQRALLSSDTIKHAYNAAFEWYCLSKFFNLPDPNVWLPQWRCTMLHGLYCGCPAGLSSIGDAIGLPQDKKKMGIGKRLINIFCKPCKPSKSNGYRNRTLPHHEPEKWQLFKEYCVQDVVTEMAIEQKLSAFPVPDDEQRMWELDQIINARGVRIDKELVYGALTVSEISTGELMDEATKLTGLNNPKSVPQLQRWLMEETNEEVENLQKETVNSILQGDMESEVARRVLEIRQELGKTSVTKYAAMDTAVCEDERVRGLLQFYGANRTGRWAGRLVQVQNLPRNYIESLPTARKFVKEQNLDALKLLYGNVPDTLSQLIRTAFIPAEGNTFHVADFSAIEARVIAWLAGEQWRQEVFATHGKIYEASASAMFGVPIELIKKGNPEYALRQKGKVAELALGYQGGPGALIAMGALDMGLTEEELPDIVQRWRASNRCIVDLWYAVENAALACLRTGGQTGVNGILFTHEADFQNGQDFLTITLPSGRKLYYVKPFLTSNQWGKDSIGYWGLNQTSKKWQVLETYGGKLVENIVQAIARDCLAVSIQRLEEAGFKVVMHVHDECIIDAPLEQSMDTACEIMGQPIDWAPGLLLRADGFTTDFYKKD